MRPHFAPESPSLIHRFASAVVTLVPLLLAGCRDATQPVGPSAGLSAASPSSASASAQLVNMLDACDAATFNAAVGPGTCLRQAGVRFDDFIAQLTRNGVAGAWQFAPPLLTSHLDQTLRAVNRGGEVHTFTRVAAFGGGIVPPLNALSHNPVVAPECTKLEGDDFVAPGGAYEEKVDHQGTLRFQCCIHPWMRTTVQVPSN